MFQMGNSSLARENLLEHYLSPFKQHKFDLGLDGDGRPWCVLSLDHESLYLLRTTPENFYYRPRHAILI